MTIDFFKYQGTGNDFILIDNRTNRFALPETAIRHLCDRRFGIGADGLMLLENSPGFDFRMVYFNSDGRLSTMCGNGGRCIVAFAARLGIIRDKCRFLAVDGPHEAMIDDRVVKLKMNDVKQIECGEGYYFLDTGSPHYVKVVQDVQHLDVLNEGKKIRLSPRFVEEGTNVNFIENNSDHIFVRTYERGVENETFSCGTGVTAAALVASLAGFASSRNNCLVKTPGGMLEVSFEKVLEKNFYNIWLKGPAEFVFEGRIEIPDDVPEG